MDTPLKTFLNKAGYTVSNDGTVDIRVYLAGLVQTVLTLVAIILFVLILYSGFMWLTAGGNEEQIKKARAWLTNSLIGFLIIAMSWAITTMVVSQLGT